MPPDGRQLWHITALLALGGAVTVGVAAPTSHFSLAAWPVTLPWLALAGLLGALSGLCHGVPLPVLLFAASVPVMPCAAALGAYAATSAVRLRERSPSDPTALPFAADGSTIPVAAAVVAAGVGWLFAAVAFLHPRACVSVVLLARAHGRWLLAAGLVAVALCAPSGATVPPHSRLERLRDQWSGVLGGLTFLAVAATMGGRLRDAPASAMAAAAAGMFAVAPLLWRAVTGKPALSPRRVRHDPLWDAIARSVVLALLAIGTATVATDPLPPLFAFSSAATVAALARTASPIRRRLAGPLTRWGWIPSALVLVWGCAAAGVYGIGLLALSAALAIWAGLWALPPILALALWLPLLG
jgi:hypothetical protein